MIYFIFLKGNQLSSFQEFLFVSDLKKYTTIWWLRILLYYSKTSNFLSKNLFPFLYTLSDIIYIILLIIAILISAISSKVWTDINRNRLIFSRITIQSHDKMNNDFLFSVLEVYSSFDCNNLNRLVYDH